MKSKEKMGLEGSKKHNSCVRSRFAFDPFGIWGSREKHRNGFGFFELGVENWGVSTNEIEESRLEIEGGFYSGCFINTTEFLR